MDCRHKPPLLRLDSQHCIPLDGRLESSLDCLAGSCCAEAALGMPSGHKEAANPQPHFFSTPAWNILPVQMAWIVSSWVPGLGLLVGALR